MGNLLPDGALLPRPAAQHLDGHVPGLGVPLRLLYGPLCAGQVAGAARDLKFHIFQCKILPLCLV